jgi:hypothetical protein
MLKIRLNQMNAFRGLKLGAFEQRALAYVKGKYERAYQQQGEQAMRQRIRETIEWAKTAGLNTEEGVIVALELALIYGADFDRKEIWASYIIHRAELEPDEKIERLKNYLIAEAR